MKTKEQIEKMVEDIIWQTDRKLKQYYGIDKVKNKK